MHISDEGFQSTKASKSHVLVTQSGQVTKNLVMQPSPHTVEGKNCVQQMKPMLLNATRLYLLVTWSGRKIKVIHTK